MKILYLIALLITMTIMTVSSSAQDIPFRGYPQYVPAGSFVEVAAELHQGETRRQKIIVKHGPNISNAQLLREFLIEPGGASRDARVFVPDSNLIYVQFLQFNSATNGWAEYSLGNTLSKSDADETRIKMISNGADLVLTWRERIRSLAVRIKTRDKQDAGTDNQVWFDVGFKAWDLDKDNHNDFERGSNDTYPIPLPANDYYVDDIFQVRLEKKGLFHWTRAPDGPGGGWEPESITLIVNGRDWHSVSVPGGIELDHNRPAWRQFLRTLSNEERFAWGLRVDGDYNGVGRLDEIVAALTTKFKELGISGWQTGPVEGDAQLQATAIGVIIRKPSFGTDGFASLDLRLESVMVGNSTFNVNNPNDIPHPRFIRIEYKHGGNPVPTEGARVRIGGVVKWDTDKGGFYEIHPRGPQDVQVLGPNGPLILGNAASRRFLVRPITKPAKRRRR